MLPGVRNEGSGGWNWLVEIRKGLRLNGMALVPTSDLLAPVRTRMTQFGMNYATRVPTPTTLTHFELSPGNDNGETLFLPVWGLELHGRS